MSKEFRPIFGVEDTPVSSSELKDDLQKLQEEKRRAEERLKVVEDRLRTLEQENRKLLEEIKKLHQDITEKDKKMEAMIAEIKNKELAEKLIRELAESIDRGLSEAKEKLRDEFIQISREVIKEFLMSDVVPKEEIVTKILDAVFNRIIDLKGSIKIHLNPSDVDRAFEFIGNIKEKLGNKIDIDISPDPELKVGEIKIETSKFVIERKHEEILEEIFREVLKRVFEGS